MPNRTSQLLDRTQQLLSDKDFSGALDVLGEIPVDTLSGPELGRYYILKTEAGLNVGRYFPEAIDAAIEVFRNSIQTIEFARAKYLKGWLFVATGHHACAKQELLESYVNYLRANDLSGASKSLNYLALVNVQLGNPHAAIENLHECIDIHRKTADDCRVSVRLMNLASVQLLCGNLVRASEVYRKVDIIKFRADRWNLATYHSMSAMPLAFQGEYYSSRLVLEKAADYVDGFQRERAIYLENSGWIALLEGDYKRAETILNEGLELSLKIAPESALISQIKRLLGDLCIATGRFDEAARYATEANIVAEKIGQKVEIAACLRIRAQVEQHSDKLDKAGELFKQAIDIFSQISSQYELAVTRYLAAVSGCYDQNESVALLYLAREYFESEGVAPYLAKVRKALADLLKRPAEPRPVPAKNLTIEIITRNAAMLRTLELARQVAPSSMSVLITGDTGTGKDLLAKYIHECSGLKGQFVSLNIAAVPTAMAEAELFGYAKGAYTGAVQDKPGLLEQADKGTFFLNEIGEASPEVQSKLLEVLESKSLRRLGEVKLRPVQFRLIAATNQDIKQRVYDGHFRVDLYHRLNQIPIHLSPLRERLEDIAPLTEYFLKKCGWRPNGDAKKCSDLAELLGRRDWPGNIRELGSVVARMYLLASGSIAGMIEIAREYDEVVDEGCISTVLAECDGNKSKAARLLGINESTLRYRLKRRL